MAQRIDCECDYLVIRCAARAVADLVGCADRSPLAASGTARGVEAAAPTSLFPTGNAAGSSSVGPRELIPSPSPFGLAASRDGRIAYDLEITVVDLPLPPSFGLIHGLRSVAGHPKLDLVRNLGAMTVDAPLHAQVDWNKFTVLVSAESTQSARGGAMPSC